MTIMKLAHLSRRAALSEYDGQARTLLEAWNDGRDEAIEFVRCHHPRFRDPDIPWKPRDLPADAVRAGAFELDDAREALARWYDYAGWTRLVEHVSACADSDGPVGRFESAVEAVVTGDIPTLSALLRHDPDLVRARSSRVTPFDPAVHRATLLHYVAANGVEDYRQKTPPNAVEVARALLEAGADPNSLANLYGGECTTMTLLVSSAHPAEAGLQVALVDVLVDHGADVDPLGTGQWRSPLLTALVFGYVDAARALVRRGASVGTLAAAAGLGQVGGVQRFLDAADPGERHRALALAAQNGQADAVRILIDSGVDPDRFNPDGFHSHSTPLHQAALAGHEAVVRLLVEHGARLDIEDTIWHATPLGWAIHSEQERVAAFLRSRGATSG